ncbi:MAG TPA: tRNA (uridine(34)/cytosine(34)/5-carboxymethylaminomethyluridine(34)-2'-O)-methyltransferase TrmL [Thermoanaerobacterales bacterium]|nr:tRNA (uridine(34)/cytosine(34)/5-carboxymethylaminomethyluridine(34)-2'-O)-methyltransferase TrmL [Thermoanaerobacterales bacterium]
MFNVVLVEPEIPQNTGNVARTCAAIGSTLHLVGPLGFSLEDKYLKRAGLDYWPLVEVKYYESYREFEEKNPGADKYFFSTKAKQCYADMSYNPGCYLVFGKETAGLPLEILKAHWDRCARIPMVDDARSLNLSNSVAIVVYEAMRQNGFKGLKIEGPSKK